MKKSIVTVLLTMSIVLLTACGAQNEKENTPAEEQTESALEGTQAPESENTESGEEAVQETETEEAYQETDEITVDVTDVIEADNDVVTVVGNTAEKEGYSGIIELNVPSELLGQAGLTLEAGKSYVFTVKTMMTMSIPPQMPVTAVREAGQEDIDALEAVRSEVSNYAERRAEYETMELPDIIEDANWNYPLWTQEEIKDYQDFLKEKGYTEDSEEKSYVNIREELNGSVAGY